MTLQQRQCLFTSAALVVLLFAIYWQVTGFDFVIIDDGDYAKDNPHIRTGVTLENLKWMTTARVGANWHPVTVLSPMIDNSLYGSKPGLHHLTSVGIHAVNTLLFFGLVLRMTRGAAPRAPENAESRRFWACAVVTGLFALHPLRVESVAWIAERKDVLSAFFFLLTLWMYVFYTEVRSEGERASSSAKGADPRQHSKATAYYLVALLFFALGLMSKAMVVTLPCVLVLLDYWPLRRISDFKVRTLRANVVEKLPFFALTIAFSLITFSVQKNCGAMINLHSYPFSHRVTNAIVSYARYLGMTFWPHNLAAFYPYERWTTWQIVAAVLLVAGISVACLVNWRKRPYLFVGWFIFTGMIVPVSGISQVGSQAMADRYTYLPHMALFLGLVWFIFEAFPKVKPATLATVGVVAALAYVPVTYCQIGLWHDSETLITTTLQRTRSNAGANLFLGSVRLQKQRYDEAARCYAEALRLDPTSVEAICGLGDVCGKKGDLEKAAEQYRRALEQDPEFPLALHSLGDIYLKQGKTNEAFAKYTQVLKLRPDIPEPHFEVGLLLESKHDMAGAIDHFREAIRLKPDYFDAINDLSWALATQRDDKLRNGEEAARLAARAVSLTHNNDPGALDTLAAALAEQGKFSEATQAASAAVDKARAIGDTNLVADIQSRLTLYQSHRAYRE